MTMLSLLQVYSVLSCKLNSSQGIRVNQLQKIHKILLNLVVQPVDWTVKWEKSRQSIDLILEYN